MNAQRINHFLYAALLMASMLSACASLGVQAGQPAPSATPVTTHVPTPAPQPTSTPVVITPAPDGGASNIVTLDNNNQLITLHPGENFLLKLGETYQWEPVIDNQDVISRAMTFAVIRGAQGLYSAHQPGTATLTATGDPLCRQTKPACAMPSIVFTLHIEVLP
jgi:hypothetical protein